MKNISIKVINPEAVKEAVNMAAMAAKLTQRGHKIIEMSDMMDLYNNVTSESIRNLVKLPHPTLQKFSVINIAVCGVSRRFLAQITRHQNEVKFMSTSMQYSDYSGYNNFVIPYELLNIQELCRDEIIDRYLFICRNNLLEYEAMVNYGINHDDAAYLLPQSLRTAMIISATPYQWKHMIRQRICHRNSNETRYVMLKIWEALYDLDNVLFGYECLPDCCKEGKLSCNKPINKIIKTPSEILKEEFKCLYD